MERCAFCKDKGLVVATRRIMRREYSSMYSCDRCNAAKYLDHNVYPSFPFGIYEKSNIQRGLNEYIVEPGSENCVPPQFTKEEVNQ